MPDEALARIFDRFARADAARTRSAGGVGLGLAIVDAIAKAHGGRCTVQNTGHGSIFALQLPRSRRGARPAQRRPELSCPRRDLERRSRAGVRCRSPANSVGVVTTPPRTPDSKSRRTRAATAAAAPVGVEAVEVQPERPRPLPQVGILEPALVGEQQVVHLPEAALERRPPRPRTPPPTRADGSSGPGKCRNTQPQRARRRAAAQRGAVRALEVGVLDHQRRVAGPRTWSSARRAPGRAPSRGRSAALASGVRRRGRRRSGSRREDRSGVGAW